MNKHRLSPYNAHYIDKTYYFTVSRDIVLEASASARGGLEAVFFSWLGLASASNDLDLTASALPHSFCLSLGSVWNVAP